MPSLIILEVAPHRHGSPGTRFCHQMIFHPKLCCLHSWSCEGRSREGGGKASTSPPLRLRVPCGSHAPAAAAFLRDGDSSGKGIQLPNPLIPPETRISGVSSFGSGAWPAGVPVACLRESRTAQISPIGQFLFHALSPAKDNHTPKR